ncbi:HDOD domain-containing protein [Undibacterium sp. CY18W]|uniref:HDOD domain-containing protein n=1 Tax=Undibacterium hunanense TaxID=2762292 RepID=A0ABR6ZUL2_9BURK|nr:HDOD domain-containing protein [Undibacterium hunanense]MBC3919540.1 HDOD domain-containing protein [Undibacterium hunanense]
MNKIDALNSIAEQAQRGELVFPTNVAASLKLQQTLDDPDCSIDTATKLVLNEPFLAARMVAIANSAAYSRGSDVTNVKAAINRLGFRTLRAVVASLVVRQLAGTSKNKQLQIMTNKLWEHTAQVAALSQVIARRITKLDPDTAMFAGIVHEVGNFYLLSRVDEYPSLIERDLPAPDSSPDDLPSFSDTIIDRESSETQIGSAVIQSLKLPQAVVEAVQALWFGLRAMPPETLGDTLLLANELATTHSPMDIHSYAEESEQYSSEIDFVVGDGTLNSILEESEEEVKTLAAALLV